MDAAEAFRQLQLRFTDPIQFDYEVIRPILLEDLTVAERSRQYGFMILKTPIKTNKIVGIHLL